MMSQLLADGEITPGIASEEYISRRKRLLEVLPEKSLAIIASADQQMMTDVVPYPFRQSGDYLYITGCTQPGGVAVLSEESGLCMFMPDTNKEDIVWQGQTAGVEAAMDFFKADKAFPLSQLQKILPEMIERSKMVYHNVKTSSSYKNLDAFRRASLNKKVKDLAYYTDELRWVKSKSEVKLMRESASIVSQFSCSLFILHCPNEMFLPPGWFCDSALCASFHPVVGGGANGSVIHYSRNDNKIKTGDLLLMDVGCHNDRAGIYIPPVPILKENAPERYRGIGIRIEDEVLVTETGHEVLTASVPKEIPHLTTLMSMGDRSAAMDAHELQQQRAACS
ncbi:hypothetical protein PR202_ga12164 [Eleusine coracana subsp. coracana]|uniref:Aminopeptidase P N-terminal domain-containing protein n=1 Tax=Eleusine coracana subsp. coracana TaxID=191504 RepID=A0AAV5CAY4_ELECO|nr:hypothetical protein PR202_ga12164 [Eleusine coracana subsp. coracana]